MSKMQSELAGFKFKKLEPLKVRLKICFLHVRQREFQHLFFAYKINNTAMTNDAKHCTGHSRGWIQEKSKENQILGKISYYNSLMSPYYHTTTIIPYHLPL